MSNTTPSSDTNQARRNGRGTLSTILSWVSNNLVIAIGIFLVPFFLYLIFLRPNQSQLNSDQDQASAAVVESADTETPHNSRVIPGVAPPTLREISVDEIAVPTDGTWSNFYSIRRREFRWVDYESSDTVEVEVSRSRNQNKTFLFDTSLSPAELDAIFPLYIEKLRVRLPANEDMPSTTQPVFRVIYLEKE